MERFEGYIGGKEICDGWSELTDPVEQRARFESDVKAARKDKEEAQQVDEDFLEAMEYGMPPTGGIGIGIDRLTMFFTNTWAIKEVMIYPTLRPVRYDRDTPKNTDIKEMDHEKYDVYQIDSQVKHKFPGISFAYVNITGVGIKKSDPDLEGEKKRLLNSKSGLDISEISSIPSIKSYIEIFKQTGVDYGSRRPSPEALLRRVVQGKGIYNINTAVDAYNLAVIETGVGLGGFDLDKISGPVALRFSSEGETIHLLGDDKATTTREGELVYSDNEKVLTIDLNYRDIDSTKITEKTKNVILFADGGPGISDDLLVNALEKGAKNIQKYCGGEISDLKIIR